jgi:aldehyde dehydrogenase (NAD+)
MDIKKTYGLEDAMKKLGVKDHNGGTSTGSNWMAGSGKISSVSPVDGKEIASLGITTPEDFEKTIQTASEAFKTWSNLPAPERGEVVRQLSNRLRELKDPLGRLVSYEMGKSLQEGWGEVQEMIDICDFAVGLSRQLYGLTIKSERPDHAMQEQWHPLGITGIISAFNFPVAVWSWNTALAWVCGNVTVWKPSEKAPLTGIACQNIIAEVLKENDMPEGISCLINGDYKVGEMMTKDARIPLVSATGSIKMGKIVGQEVASRLGKSILELGGNNAMIISKEADLKMTLIGAVFGAVGTAGQRCTSTRRLIIHEDIYDDLIGKMTDAYKQIRIGNPLDEKNHVGPVIDKDSVNNYLNAIEKAKAEGGKVLVEGGVLEGEGYESGCYVKPVIIEAENSFEIVQEETFAPILYVMKYSGDIENAIALQNGVKQGLSSAIMTNNMQEAHRYLSSKGSDCGIANVNIGTSGAEIGGAFGGEKETGGGRESGSDAWKAYMRRQTNTLNYGNSLPLAQGIKFDI